MRHVAVTEGDKVEAQIRLGVHQRLRRDRPRRGRRAVAEPEVDRLLAAYAEEYDVAPELGPAVPGATNCARPPASRLPCATFLEDGGFGAFTDTFEDLDGLRSCRASQRSD
jgi:L-arabinose isomerase